MSTPAVPVATACERLMTFDDVNDDVLRVNIGDTVEIPDFAGQFDPLVVSLVNANLAPDPAGSRVIPWNEFYLRPDCPRPLGTYAVQHTLGMSPRGKQLFSGWPSTMRLPSELILPRNQRAKVMDASVTLLDKPADDPSLRSVDLLLQGSVRPVRGTAHSVLVRLSAQKGATNTLRAKYTTLAEDAAAHAVAAALRRTGGEQAAL